MPSTAGIQKPGSGSVSRGVTDQMKQEPHAGGVPAALAQRLCRHQIGCMKCIIRSWLCLACCGLMIAGCATSAQQRGPWHEYLHEHNLE